MGLNAAAYRAQLQALLPSGAAWPRAANAALTRLLDALAEEFARVDARGGSALDEADGRAALELLADWERVCGLPDTCGAGVATTLQERRAAVVAKLTALGGASPSYFLGLAEAMGYTVELDEFRPFLTGVNRCGDRLGGGAAVRHQWRIRVTGPRFTAFRAGASQCGDLLGKIDRAADLECKLKRLKPAHTRLIFSYEGA
ncbi:YmfQ family protein [Rhodocyclus tenuis]|uniref:Uncharacterized protein YmfQ (DUF2313 family) n=1 Tax=Rhodocyclus tenuis TaxID=1066 RepID=A0A840FWV3_RHOTE|nr:putative phage tail protein [Rhodocyclus tenuis]MBB4246567.1 uncharacterized protein YmfQ (DUF2313 family) [Rhodocyclus tenuis]